MFIEHSGVGLVLCIGQSTKFRNWSRYLEGKNGIETKHSSSLVNKPLTPRLKCENILRLCCVLCEEDRAERRDRNIYSQTAAECQEARGRAGRTGRAGVNNQVTRFCSDLGWFMGRRE